MKKANFKISGLITMYTFSPIVRSISLSMRNNLKQNKTK